MPKRVCGSCGAGSWGLCQGHRALACLRRLLSPVVLKLAGANPLPSLWDGLETAGGAAGEVGRQGAVLQLADDSVLLSVFL